jgi:cell division protein YceG involved in septum cleavage
LEIANLIDSGKIKLVKITIPEGWRTEQIAARLSANNILDYKDFLEAAKPYEGKLFPDTYLLNPRMKPSEELWRCLKFTRKERRE